MTAAAFYLDVPLPWPHNKLLAYWNRWTSWLLLLCSNSTFPIMMNHGSPTTTNKVDAHGSGTADQLWKSLTFLISPQVFYTTALIDAFYFLQKITPRSFWRLLCASSSSSLVICILWGLLWVHTHLPDANEPRWQASVCHSNARRAYCHTKLLKKQPASLLTLHGDNTQLSLCFAQWRYCTVESECLSFHTPHH